jgi:hypothetical protein
MAINVEFYSAWQPVQVNAGNGVSKSQAMTTPLMPETFSQLETSL